MLAKIKHLFQFPYFTDPDKTRTARILQIFLWVIIALMGIHLLLELVGVFEPKPSDFIIEAGMILLLLGLLAANRLGYTQIAGFIFVLLLWTAFTLFSFTNRGLRGTAVIAYLAILTTTSLLLGWRVVVGFTLLCIMAVMGMAYAEETGLISPTLDAPYSVAIEINFILVWSAIALVIATTGLRHALQRARQSEQSLLERNKELEDIRVSLEEQVMVRTRGLQQVAILTEQLNAILNFEQLLLELVEGVQEKFGYYYVQVYLLDDNRQNLVMAAGSGEVGQQLKDQKHHLVLNAPTGLVARAARENRIVRVDNVTQSVDWLVNPLLSRTQAELAVPIVLEERVVGVLDVQVDRVAGLDETDASVLRTLANQVAVAIRNARLFEQTQVALTEARLAQERYVTQAWHASGSQVYTAKTQRAEAAELTEAIRAELSKTAQQQAQPGLIEGVMVDSPEEIYTAIVAPIKLQNQVIGGMYFHQAGDSLQANWSEQELALVQAIADQVAQTAENLRLFEETREQAGREQAIREVTDKLRAAPSLERLLETAARELGQRLEAPQTVLEVGIRTDDPGPVYQSGNGRK